MAVTKLSISLDEDAAAAARAAAEAAGLSLSAWISRTALETAALEEGKRGVREFIEENGPIPDEAKQWAKEVVTRHGVGRRR